MIELVATKEIEYKGFVIHYGSYERKAESGGWNGLYRIFKDGQKQFGADFTSQPPFETEHLAAQASLNVAEKWVNERTKLQE